MSYSEKPEDMTREEWMDKVNNVHIQRADMNRLIMNYLVTGDVSVNISISASDTNIPSSHCMSNRGLQRGSGEIQGRVWNRAERGLGFPG